MTEKRSPFLNFQVDHMTLLVQPELYNVSYLIFRTIFGAPADEILYNKRKDWGEGEKSMTFAARIGTDSGEPGPVRNTIIATVQPTEPADQRSHVREMLSEHDAAAHWQHIALRTPDLLTFHRHATERGVRFITPILHDESQDLIQAFTGEWYFPGQKPSGMFFEFLQREPSSESLKRLEERNREAWFRDKVFLGLYSEKEAEYQKGHITPFIDDALFQSLAERFGSKNLWEISEEDVREAETLMLEYAKAHPEAVPA